MSAKVPCSLQPEFDARVEQLAVHTIAGLTMDAVQAANSGHPGMPMGMADIATVLWSRFLRYDPSDPAWPDRDRVVLSNGHGSMLLYSMLYLTGTALTLDDLKNFRQWGSPTAGHPEYGAAPGIETTTGPLGQGLANGVGMAIAERWLADRFGPELVDHRTWVLAGDGCMMEGITSEAASLAGHLRLGRLIVIYDDNHITIDGGTELSFSEDVAARYRAYGWHVQRVDGHDREALAEAMEAARAVLDQPSLICARTVIAHGSPHKAGTAASHGAPLGPDEVRATKLAMGMDLDRTFVVPDEVLAFFRARDDDRRREREAWQERLQAHPDRALWQQMQAHPDPDAVDWPVFEPGTKLATRKAGKKTLEAIAAAVPSLLGGSADLTDSNGTNLVGARALAPGDFSGTLIHFGVREHAMAAICNGLALHGGVRPFCATFLAFHDYMRPAVRLAALMKQPVAFIYTHDSVWLGEDGPTHQPIEQLSSMRAMPNLWVVRPADAAEVNEAWRMALTRNDGPTAICLTRQGVPVLDRTELAPAENARYGGYVLADGEGEARVVLIATGSEVSLALLAREALQADGVPTRVVSMMCCEAFDAQPAAYREKVLPLGVPRVSIEAGVTYGWERYVGFDGACVGIDRFGASAPGPVVADRLGLNVDHVVRVVRDVLARAG